MNLNHYLAVRVLPVGAIMVLLLGIGLMGYSKYINEFEIERAHQVAGDQFHGTVLSGLQGLVSDVEAVANSDLVINALVDTQRRESYLPLYLRSIAIAGNRDDAILITDYKGRLLVANKSESAIPWLVQTDWQHPVLRESQTYYAIDEDGILIAAPIMFSDSAEGAVVTKLSMANVAKRLYVRSDSMGFMITTANGKVIYSNNQDLLRSGSVVDFSQDPDWYFREGAEIPQFGIKLMTFQRMTDTELLLTRLYYVIIGSVFAIILMGFLIITITSRALGKTMLGLGNTISFLMNEEQNRFEKRAEIDPTIPMEITDLASKFNQLLDKLSSSTTSKQAFRCIIDSLDEMLVVTDFDGQFVNTNPLFERFKGQLIGECTTQSDVRIIFQFGDIARLKGMDHVDNRFDMEYELKQDDDVIDVTIEWRKSPLLSETEQVIGYIFTGQDVTERLRNERALMNARREAEAASVAKGEFLASMSHEIRTPMNGVLGVLELLMKTDLTEKQIYFGKLAQNSAKSLLTLINDILDFSKIEANKLDLESYQVNLLDIFCELMEAFSLSAQDKGVEFVLDVANIHVNEVFVDGGRLRQILTNLISNAIKFTSDGAVKLQGALVEHDAQHWQLNFSVTDSGIGIPEEVQANLFTAFTQADSSTTRKYGGTGLGLTIVRRLCHMMQGEIGVRSETGKGSCFYGSILVEKCDASDSGEVLTTFPDLSVAIVEDNAVVSEALAAQLRVWGVHVHCFSGATEFIAHERDEIKSDLNQFDGVLIDRDMPSMSGTDLCRNLMHDARWATIRKILMVPMADQLNVDQVNELGLAGYFGKPATPEKLKNALGWLLVKEARDTQGNTASGEGGFGEEYQLRALLVDDNEINQLVALGILEDFGLTNIAVADNGKHALEALEQAPSDSPFELILMDCQMPQMDGYEATRLIRQGAGGERHQNIPIIALTANAMQGDAQKCYDAGMNDYTSKPIDSEILYKKIKKWL